LDGEIHGENLSEGRDGREVYIIGSHAWPGFDPNNIVHPNNTEELENNLFINLRHLCEKISGWSVTREGW
jgi:hypothetical protein